MARAEESVIGVPPRQARVAQTVARHLLTTAVGERIPTIATLAAQSGAGIGTVQSALRTLTEAGAVRLSSHGHQGTRLDERDLGRLWSFAGSGALVGILPFPSSLEFAGLATALSEAFDRADVPASLTFRHGSRHRLALLETGRADFLVASAAFADSLPAQHVLTVTLPPYTYFERGSVVVITRAGERPEPGSRVLVDRGSTDHVTLTEAEFPDAQLVDAPSSQIPDQIVLGAGDAAIWHQTSASSLLTATELAIHPPSRPSPSAEERFSRAALIVVRGEDGRSAPGALLEELIDVEALTAVQRDVIDRRRVPSF